MHSKVYSAAAHKALALMILALLMPQIYVFLLMKPMCGHFEANVIMCCAFIPHHPDCFPYKHLEREYMPWSDISVDDKKR